MLYHFVKRNKKLNIYSGSYNFKNLALFCLLASQPAAVRYGGTGVFNKMVQH